jgi:hypothetical protein
MQRLRVKSCTPDYDIHDPDYPKSYVVKRDKLRSTLMDLKTMAKNIKIDKLDRGKEYSSPVRSAIQDKLSL